MVERLQRISFFKCVRKKNIKAECTEISTKYKNTRKFLRALKAKIKNVVPTLPINNKK